MDGKQVRFVIEKYTRLIDARGARPRRAPTDKKLCLSSVVFEHCAWMLVQMKQMHANGEYEKFNRWLGFIQGCLWSSGTYSIDEMREDNRPPASL